MSVIIGKNQTAGALALTQLPVPNQEIPASGQVTLTDYASVSEIQNDREVASYIAADDLLLNIDGDDQTKEQSLAAQSPVTFPVDDTTELVRDPVTTTKRVRLDAGSVAAGATRVLAMPDQNVDLAPNTGTFPAALHAARHQPGGTDAMAVDAAAATGSLRTLGTGAQQSCAGNDSRLSDARTPTGHATSHQHNGVDEVATATPAANAIPKARADARLSRYWLNPSPVDQPGEWATFSRGVVQTAGSISTSTVQYARVWLPAGITINNMKCNVVGGGSTTRYIRLGLYSQATPTSPTGTPNTKVAETAQVNTNTPGTNTVPLTASYLVPTSGYYWVAFICDASQPSFRATGSGSGGFWPLYFEASAGTTLPATAGTLTQPTSAAIWAAAVE